MDDTAVDPMLEQMVNLKIKKMHISIEAEAITLKNEHRKYQVHGEKEI